MKIVGQRVFVANASRTNFVFVKLYTDAGIDGVGEATLEWRTKTVVAALEDAERFVVGKDPFAIEHLTATLHRDSYWRTGAVFRTALGAIEAALLDIKGKALGVPVFELLGGKHRDRLKCYANHWFYGAETPDDYAAAAKRAVAVGFRALKWDPFGSVWLEMDRRERTATIANVEAVRDAVGPDVDLMIDVHGRLNVPTAIAIARALERYDLAWIEEPTPPELIDALAEVRAKSAVPIAAGERFFEPERFLEAIAKRAVDYLQPDVAHARRPVGDQEDRGLRPCQPPAGRAAQSDRPGDECDDPASGGRDPQFQHIRDCDDGRALASRAGQRDTRVRRRRPPCPPSARPRRGTERRSLRPVSVSADRLAALHRAHEPGWGRSRGAGGRLAT